MFQHYDMLLTVWAWVVQYQGFRKNPNPPFFGDGWLNHDEIIGENPFWGHGGGHVAVGGAICPTAFFLL